MEGAFLRRVEYQSEQWDWTGDLDDAGILSLAICYMTTRKKSCLYDD